MVVVAVGPSLNRPSSCPSNQNTQKRDLAVYRSTGPLSAMLVGAAKVRCAEEGAAVHALGCVQQRKGRTRRSHLRRSMALEIHSEHTIFEKEGKESYVCNPARPLQESPGPPGPVPKESPEAFQPRAPKSV